ncbi:MAG: hypothetical protein V2I63_11490 [Pseudomonadales bacterium]|jgi:hypothetical protein|nr:hypothetical protein [Pseudomonadales bacterium]
MSLGFGRIRLHRRVTLALQAILMLELTLALWRSQWQTALLVAAILLVTLAPLLLGRRLRIVVIPEFEALAVLFAFASLFLGEIHGWYDRFWWWDMVLHLGSGFLGGILGFVLVHVLNEETDVRMSMRPGFVALFAFMFSLGFGTLWEIFEFAMDLAFDMNMQKSGLADTMGDLVVDAIGALAMALLGYRYLSRPTRQSFLDHWIARFIARNPRFFRRRGRRQQVRGA